MWDTVGNKELYRRRRTPTQDPSSDVAAPSRSQDAWRQSALAGPLVNKDLSTRMAWVFRRAAKAMLITSLTTFGAFSITARQTRKHRVLFLAVPTPNAIW